MSMKPTRFRWFLAGLMFLLNFVAYMDRVNISVATPAIIQEFGFDKVHMSWILSAFFLAYAIAQVPGGMASEYFGHRRVVTLGVLWWSVFTAMTGACTSLTGFVAARFAFGLGEGPIPPTMNYFVYRWYNKAEKAFAYSFNMAGAFIGPVLGPVATVALMLSLGWRWVFIIFGVVGAVIAIAWWVFAAENPRQSKYVNEAELEYIEQGTGEVKQSKEVAPWGIFLKSPRFWALGIQYFVTDYIMFVFLAWLPMYLMEAQHFSLAKMGVAAAFPWAALAIVLLTSTFWSDKLVGRGVPKIKSRSYFGIIGQVICCFALYMVASSSDPTTTVLWLTVSLGSLGMAFGPAWGVCTDLGGRFTGSVSGWMNLWGNIGGVLAPLVTAWIATKYGWHAAILFTGATACLGILAWLAIRPDVPLVGEPAPVPVAAKAAETVDA